MLPREAPAQPDGRDDRDDREQDLRPPPQLACCVRTPQLQVARSPEAGGSGTRKGTPELRAAVASDPRELSSVKSKNIHFWDFSFSRQQGLSTCCLSRGGRLWEHTQQDRQRRYVLKGETGGQRGDRVTDCDQLAKDAAPWWSAWGEAAARKWVGQGSRQAG